MQSIWFKWQLTSWTSVQMDVEVPSSAGYTASSSSTITRLLLSALRIFSFSERYAVNALLLRSLLRLSFVRLSVKRSLRVNRTFFAARPITSPDRPGIWSVVKKTRENIPNRFPKDCYEEDVWKNRDFQPIILYLKHDTRYGHSYNGRRIGTCTRSSECCHFQWHWVFPNPNFKDTALFDVEYLSNGTR